MSCPFMKGCGQPSRQLDRDHHCIGRWWGMHKGANSHCFLKSWLFSCFLISIIASLFHAVFKVLDLVITWVACNSSISWWQIILLAYVGKLKVFSYCLLVFLVICLLLVFYMFNWSKNNSCFLLKFALDRFVLNQAYAISYFSCRYLNQRLPCVLFGRSTLFYFYVIQMVASQVSPFGSF